MKKFIIAALAFTPAIASAQQLTRIDILLSSVGDIVDAALPIVVGIGLLVFMWGLVRFIFAGAEAKEEGKTLMIWGLVALFVMVSVWGIIRWAGDLFDVDQGADIEVPGVQGL